MFRIIKASADQAIESNLAESRFLVESELIPNFRSGELGYEVVAVAPYEKVYPPSGPIDETTAPGVSFHARRESPVVGRIALSQNWNEFAYVNHLAVEPSFRRSGIGCALVQQPTEWSQAERLAGVMLETQNNNVAACKLYERCGFQLRGSIRTCTVGATLEREKSHCSGTGGPNLRRCDARAFSR